MWRFVAKLNTGDTQRGKGIILKLVLLFVRILVALCVFLLKLFKKGACLNLLWLYSTPKTAADDLFD